LIFFHQNNVIPKEVASVLKEGKRNPWNNNKKEKDFVKLVDNKGIMTIAIALQNFLLDVS